MRIRSRKDYRRGLNTVLTHYTALIKWISK